MIMQLFTIFIAAAACLSSSDITWADRLTSGIWKENVATPFVTLKPHTHIQMGYAQSA